MKEFLKLIRIKNLLIAVFAVLVGYYLAKGSLEWRLVVPLILSTSFIFAGGNILNDYFDFPVDIINKPERPLPAGKIDSTLALVIGIFCLIMGVVISIFISWNHFAFALAAAVLLFAYDFFLKQVPFWGNFIISLLCGGVFIYSGMARRLSKGCWIAAIFALLYHFGREIIKDIADMKGDEQLGIKTIPIVYGEKTARTTSAIMFILIIVFSFYPYFSGYFSLVYFVPILGLDIFLGHTIFNLLKFSRKIEYELLSFFIKLNILLGLVALIAGKLFQ